jgi:hypothetical protein
MEEHWGEMGTPIPMFRSTYYASGVSSEICGSVNAMMSWALNVDRNDYFYLLLTSNSNSFVSGAPGAAGIVLPPPPNSPGWGNALVPVVPGSIVVPIGEGF